MGKGGLVLQAHAMVAFFIDMEGKGDVIFPQGIGKEHGIFHGHGLVFNGCPQEAGRSIGGDLQFVGQGTDQFWRWIGSEQINSRCRVREFPHGNDGVT